MQALVRHEQGDYSARPPADEEDEEAEEAEKDGEEGAEDAQRHYSDSSDEDEDDGEGSEDSERRRAIREGKRKLGAPAAGAVPRVASETNALPAALQPAGQSELDATILRTGRVPYPQPVFHKFSVRPKGSTRVHESPKKRDDEAEEAPDPSSKSRDRVRATQGCKGFVEAGDVN